VPGKSIFLEQGEVTLGRSTGDNDTQMHRPIKLYLSIGRKGKDVKIMFRCLSIFAGISGLFMIYDTHATFPTGRFMDLFPGYILFPGIEFMLAIGAWLISNESSNFG